MHIYFEPAERRWRAWLSDGRSFEICWLDGWSFGLKISESGGFIAVPGLKLFFPTPGSKESEALDVNNTWDYGFHFVEGHLHLDWGRQNNWISTADHPRRSACLTLPWADWRHVRHDVLSEPEEHTYRYRCDSGDVQEVKATIQVEEREWRLLGLWPRKVSRYINVDFDAEVGEARGSWKGGTTGCGWDMLTDETPQQALRRMERDRRFR